MASRNPKSSAKRIKSIGYAADKPNARLKPFRFERRELRSNDILVDILYCGICHSDVHKVRAEWGDFMFPLVPGHEIVGKVMRVGPSVKKFKVGDTVGVGCMVGSCGRCEACKAGEEYDCPESVWTYGSKEQHVGGNTYGGYSNNMVVGEAFTLKIPPGVNLAATAPLLCAGTTTFSPLEFWKAGPGKKVGIVGLGGLGHVAVKLAHSMGAKVVVFTTSRDKRRDAMRLGANEAVVIGDKKAVGKYFHSLDLIVDTASAPHDMDMFLSLLKRDGQLALVGLQSQPLSVEPFSLINGHHVLAGSGLGGIRDTQRMLDYCAKHGIEADIELIPIQKVNEAYERIVKGNVKYRFVIDMSSL